MLQKIDDQGVKRKDVSCVIYRAVPVGCFRFWESDVVSWELGMTYAWRQLSDETFV